MDSRMQNIHWRTHEGLKEIKENRNSQINHPLVWLHCSLRQWGRCIPVSGTSWILDQITWLHGARGIQCWFSLTQVCNRGVFTPQTPIHKVSSRFPWCATERTEGYRECTVEAELGHWLGWLHCLPKPFAQEDNCQMSVRRTQMAFWELRGVLSSRRGYVSKGTRIVRKPGQRLALFL